MSKPSSSDDANIPNWVKLRLKKAERLDEFNNKAEKLIASFDFEKAASILLVLSNRMRIEILIRLLNREWNVNALSGAIGLTQSATSQHLAIMRKMDLVSTRKAAQQIFYTCESDDVRQIFMAIEDLDFGKNTIEVSVAGQRRSGY